MEDVLLYKYTQPKGKESIYLAYYIDKNYNEEVKNNQPGIF